MLKLFTNKKINYTAGFILACLIIGLVIFIVFNPKITGKACSATSVTNSAGLGADRIGIGTITWGTPTNIYTSNDAYATAAAGVSHYLNASLFGFAIGADQQIDGIKVEIEKIAACFTGDTEISTPFGLVPIKHLKEGDIVYSQKGYGKVLRISRHIVSEYLLIETKNYSVKTTAEHPFYTDKGLVVASKLKIGSKVLVGDKYEKVIVTTVIKRKVKVYDITVSGSHNYFANNFAVHNKATPEVSDNRVSIVKADNTIGTLNYAQEDAWGYSVDAYYTYGGATDKWGETWTYANINDADFGVVISASVGISYTAKIDHIRITVYYSDIYCYGTTDCASGTACLDAGSSCKAVSGGGTACTSCDASSSACACCCAASGSSALACTSTYYTTSYSWVTSNSSCCGDDTGETNYEQCAVYSGSSIAWSCTSSDDACCSAISCVKGGVCKAQTTYHSGLNPGGNDNYAYCTQTTAQWQDVDDTSTRCTGAGLNWAVGGSGDCTGESCLTNCCGDDASELYRSGGIGSPTVTCCNASTDCVDTGSCISTGSYSSTTCQSTCNRYLCSSGTWGGSTCSARTCSAGSCTTTCETDCGASASCDAKTYNADVCTNNVAITFCNSSCVSSAGDGKCESNGVNGCSSVANCDELEENEEVCNASSVQTGVCSSTCAWATTGAGTCEAGGGINSCSADTWADEIAAGACAAGGSSGCPSGSRCCAGNGTYGTSCKGYDDDYSSAICTSLDARTWTTVTTGDLETDSSNCTAGVTYCGDGVPSNGFCCGDDTSENYVTQGVGTAACCDSASDCVDSGDVCRTEWSTEVTCSDGIDNDCDGLTDAADPNCVSYTPKSQNWKWYDDEWDCDSSVSTHDAGQTCANSANGSALAAENTVPTGVGKLNAIKLRITINETAGAAGTDVKMRTQYAQKVGADCNDGDESFAYVAGQGQISEAWRYFDGTAGTNDSDNTTLGANRLTDSGSNKATHNETPTGATTFDHTASTAFEWEFTIQNFNGTANTSYCFRIYNNTNAAVVPTNTAETLPELTAASAYDLSMDAPTSAAMPNYQLGSGTSGSNSNQFTDKDISVWDRRGTGAGWALTATSIDWTSASDTIINDDIDWTTDTIKAQYAENTSCSANVGVCAGTANSSFAGTVTIMDADADASSPSAPGWGGYVVDAWTLRIINIDARLTGTYQGTISFSLT